MAETAPSRSRPSKPSLLRTHSIEALIAASDEPEKRLRKSLGPWSLTALGIGAVIGSGIFILTGTAAAGQNLQFKSILNAPVLDLLLNGRIENRFELKVLSGC